MIVYRICSAAFPKNDGEGASIAGGRWNQKGTALIYCAENSSLAALEVLVHASELPADKVIIEVDIPEEVSILKIPETGLPKNWSDVVAPSETQALGTAWASSGSTAVLSVPSTVNPRERNYLLNPAHPDFRKIKFSKPQRFVFDPRLK